jgi:hypothetical protein
VSIPPPYIAPGRVLMVPVSDGLVMVRLDRETAAKLSRDLAKAIGEAKP